jgi:hypothetical protein
MSQTLSRCPESLEMKQTHAERTTSVKNYGNQNTWQKIPETFGAKRIALHESYKKVRKVAAEFNVSCVKTAFGDEIVRVCCRTIEQLDNIGSILEELMKVDFIMEIGMPFEYFYEMNRLVLLIKPKDNKFSNSIEHAIKERNLGSAYVTVEEKDPSIAAEKFLKELETNNSVQEREKVPTIPQNRTKMSLRESAAEKKREIKKLHTILLMLTINFIFLLLYIIFDLRNNFKNKQIQIYNPQNSLINTHFFINKPSHTK